MGCSNCGTGKPSGCNNNGGCSSGGCNRLNVHDWLVDMPIANRSDIFPYIEVSFNQGRRKDFYKNINNDIFFKGDYITVEGVGGFDVGEVNLIGELVKLQMKRKGFDYRSKEVKKVLRPSSEKEIELLRESKEKEKDLLKKTREIIIDMKMQMKMTEIELQADGKKATFFYSSEERVDFRELLKVLASEFKFKIEMRQIGARQEAAKVGGIGICGRELCCSTWLHDFKGVNTAVARYQNLSLNQSKLSGQCGRLKCCLNYELNTYLDALQHFPEDADVLETLKGRANLIKKDIFKHIIWYAYQGTGKLICVPVERAKEIRALNKSGKKPEDLIVSEALVFAFERGRERGNDAGFVDLVGQVSSRALDRHDKKRKADKKKKPTHSASENPNPKNNPPNNTEKKGGNQIQRENALPSTMQQQGQTPPPSFQKKKPDEQRRQNHNQTRQQDNQQKHHNQPHQRTLSERPPLGKPSNPTPAAREKNEDKS